MKGCAAQWPGPRCQDGVREHTMLVPRGDRRERKQCRQREHHGRSSRPGALDRAAASLPVGTTDAPCPRGVCGAPLGTANTVSKVCVCRMVVKAIEAKPGRKEGGDGELEWEPREPRQSGQAP